ANAIRLTDGAATLAEAFADNGYVTLAAVCALPLFDRVTNLGQGFDRYSMPADANKRDGAEALEDLLTNLATYDDQPVFAWLHVYDAHAPYTPPEELERLYYAADRDPFDEGLAGAQPDLAPNWNRKIADPEFTEALYRSEVTYVDGLMARMFAVPRVERAQVAFTSDHGEQLTRGLDARYNHDGLSLNTLAVPLIFVGEGVPSGASRSEAVRQIDVGRTLLNIAGLADEPFPGQDLLAASAVGRDARFALEANGWGASILRGDRFLRLRLRQKQREPRSKVHGVELFDLANDPFCEHDLTEERFEEAKALRSELIEWLLAASPADLREAADAPSSALQAQLAELGYASEELGETIELFDADCDCEQCQHFR
ncbi:MAG: sulfatase-like hydrolase/transferase, partial [Planctomycetota bacterium]